MCESLSRNKPANWTEHLGSYVDAQLKTSRRFDAAGIEKEHPDLFVPLPRRRTSSSSSLASMTSNSTNGHDHHYNMPEGQLRYWTAEMCSKSPQLFDFVVTVSRVHRSTICDRIERYLFSLVATVLYSSHHGSSNASSLQSSHSPSAPSVSSLTSTLPTTRQSWIALSTPAFA